MPEKLPPALPIKAPKGGAVKGAARMYRDKTRRKKAQLHRGPSADNPHTPDSPDIDLHRSALGIL